MCPAKRRSLQKPSQGPQHVKVPVLSYCGLTEADNGPGYLQSREKPDGAEGNNINSRTSSRLVSGVLVRKTSSPHACNSQLPLGLQCHQGDLPQYIGRVILMGANPAVSVTKLASLAGVELTSHFVVVELIAKSIEVLSHARDVSIGDVLLSQKLCRWLMRSR